ncbi:MAG: dihydroorotate dehydrogenase [Candidatus Pelethousia sp.]|nr:dihydroorotate dehydrogenase [Candidatus Pelethousia sp.]
MSEYKTNLSTKLGSLTLKNPVMPASGAYDYFENNANLFPMSELGAVMVKSVHFEVRQGNPPPRVTEAQSGMINAVGIPSMGMERFLKEQHLARYAELGAPMVLSISGSTPEQYGAAVSILADDARVSALELNLSCPNVGTGLPFSSDPALLERTMKGVRPHTKLPIFVKLSPNVADIRPIVKAAQESGADALVIANTYRAMKIDIRKQRSVLGRVSGGFSGPAIKPMTLALVYQAYEVADIPIIGCGGISVWQDAIEYFLAGATAIQVGCINFTEPLAMPNIIRGVDNYLQDMGYESLSQIIGLAHQNNNE